MGCTHCRWGCRSAAPGAARDVDFSRSADFRGRCGLLWPTAARDQSVGPALVADDALRDFSGIARVVEAPPGVAVPSELGRLPRLNARRSTPPGWKASTNRPISASAFEDLS